MRRYADAQGGRGPWGRVVTEAQEEGDEVVVTDLDPAELRKGCAARPPALQHRRLGPAC